MFVRSKPVRCVASSPAVARQRLREALVDWDGDPAVEQAELLVSEVATNALVHGHTDEAVVDIRTSPRTVRVSVRDHNHTLPTRTVKDDPLTPGGYGVVLLDELSSRWGVVPRLGGKTVWFEVAASDHRCN